MNGGCLQVTATLAPHSVVLFEYPLGSAEGILT